MSSNMPPNPPGPPPVPPAGSPPDPSIFAPGAGRPRPPHEPIKLKCPNCASQLSIPDESGRMAVCPSCKSHLEVSDVEAKVLHQAAGHDMGLAGVFNLEVGDSFRQGDARYEVIGRLRYDEEECAPTLQYLLYNPHRGTLWLSEYEGHWDLSHASRVMPDHLGPLELKKGDELRTHDDRTWLLAGKGAYRLTWVDGALPWVARFGDVVQYAEFVDPAGSGETYEVELPDSTREIETARGSLISHEAVCRATGKRLPPPRGARENVHEITKSYGAMKKAALAAFVFNLLLLFFFVASGSEVLDQRLDVQQLSGEALTDTFEIAQAGTTIKIKLAAPLDNAWMTVDLGLVRDGEVSEPTVVHVTDQDLEYYHGVSGGERWSEGAKVRSQFLRVDEAGTYRLLLRARSGRGNSNQASASHVPVRVRVIAGARRAMWSVLATLFCLVVLVVVAAQHHKWRTADDEDDEDD